MTPNDVKIVADNIDDFIEVPDGIERLRKAVLTLAVSGKLVTQDSKDGTGEALFAKIQIERIKIEDGTNGRKAKSKRTTSEIVEDPPFDIPKSWRWVRLGAVTNYGRTEKTKGGKIKGGEWILELEDLEKDGGRLLSIVEYPQRKPQSDKNIFKQGDVLYGKLRPYLNKVIVAERDGISSSELLPVRWYNQGSSEYLRLVMLSGYFSEYVNQRVYGMKMPRLGTEDGQNAPVPLPPFSEQIRIVKKAKELMGQINQLDAKRRERDEIRSRLTRSAMQSLGKGESKVAFEQLVELIKTTNDLKELENSIIALAVTGQLAEQTISGEDSTVWAKRKLGDIAEITSSKRIYKSDYSTQGVPFYRISEISALAAGRKIKGELFISERKFKEIQNKFGSPKVGDVLLTAVGTIGKIYIVDAGDIFYFKDGNVLWFRNLNGVDSEFLKLVLMHAIRQMQSMSVGAVYKALTIVKLKELRFLMPPLAEQKRIVKKVEEIMSLVNKLKPLVAKEK